MDLPAPPGWTRPGSDSGATGIEESLPELAEHVGDLGKGQVQSPQE